MPPSCDGVRESARHGAVRHVGGQRDRGRGVLGHRIGYNDIYRLVASAVERAEFIAQPTLEEILASDAEARELVRREIG